jgi:phage tail-like protein
VNKKGLRLLRVRRKGDPTPREFRKNILIDLLNEAGQLVIRFKVFRCWPSAYVALYDLDAEDPAVAYEMLTFQNEGWERDTGVVEPQEL